MKGCRSLEPAEIKAIALSLSMRDRAIFVLGIRSGFRIAELLSLNVGDVLVNGSMLGAVRVRRSEMKGKTESRTIPIHSEAKAVLREYLATRQGAEPSAPLFLSAGTGGRLPGRLDYSAYRKALKKVISRARIRDAHLVSTHSCRKTFAKKFYEACGKDLYLTQQALGHSHVGITVKYLQKDGEMVSNLILKMK